MAKPPIVIPVNCPDNSCWIESLRCISKFSSFATFRPRIFLNSEVASPILASRASGLLTITVIENEGLVVATICLAFNTGITQNLSPPNPALEPFEAKTPITLNLLLPIKINLLIGSSFLSN